MNNNKIFINIALKLLSRTFFLKNDVYLKVYDRNIFIEKN